MLDIMSHSLALAQINAKSNALKLLRSLIKLENKTGRDAMGEALASAAEDRQW
jgi:hypothetical protein